MLFAASAAAVGAAVFGLCGLVGELWPLGVVAAVLATAAYVGAASPSARHRASSWPFGRRRGWPGTGRASA
jgi:hypothetical protein